MTDFLSKDPKPFGKHDLSNPNPWHALLVDQSTMVDPRARHALLVSNDSKSRQFLFPILRPLARLTIVLVQLLRIVMPKAFTSSKILHKLIVWGMANFLKKEANYLILRHFHIGSQILSFLNQNIAGGTLPSHPLKPKKIKDLEDHVFVQHDLNIFNFVISLGEYLQAEGRDIQPKALVDIDFSMITDVDDELEALPDGVWNFMDLHSAVESYTPLFGLFLSDDDFWRASNSLQLDETIAVYTAKLTNAPEILGLVNNKHPMVPLSTFEAGFRLMLHGLDAENLYGYIRHLKAEAEKAQSKPKTKATPQKKTAAKNKKTKKATK